MLILSRTREMTYSIDIGVILRFLQVLIEKFYDVRAKMPQMY